MSRRDSSNSPTPPRSPKPAPGRHRATTMAGLAASSRGRGERGGGSHRDRAVPATGAISAMSGTAASRAAPEQFTSKAARGPTHASRRHERVPPPTSAARRKRDLRWRDSPHRCVGVRRCRVHRPHRGRRRPVVRGPRPGRLTRSSDTLRAMPSRRSHPDPDPRGRLARPGRDQHRAARHDRRDRTTAPASTHRAAVIYALVGGPLIFAAFCCS